jgi:hypothetical protein
MGDYLRVKVCGYRNNGECDDCGVFHVPTVVRTGLCVNEYLYLVSVSNVRLLGYVVRVLHRYYMYN